MNGKKFIIPNRKNYHYQHLLDYENYYGAFIEAAASLKAGTFVDVGVNVGQILLKLRSFDRSRQYVGFEVSVSCCEYVNEIIDLNQLQNCMIVPLGLTDKRGTISLHYSSAIDPQATLVGNFWTPSNQRRYERTVYVDTGDSVLSAGGFEEVGIIKVDVEGGELEALLGLKETIIHYQPLILVEVLPFINAVSESEAPTMRRRKERCLQLEAFLLENGYHCYRALPGFQIEEARSFGADSFDADRTNYVMVANGDDARFRALFS